MKAGMGNPDGDTEFTVLDGSEEVIARDAGGNIPDEHTEEFSNEAGTLSMANTGEPNSGGSQIFINVGNNANLDWFSPGPSQHPVFGKVIENYELVVEISRVPTNDDNPVKPIKMISITIENAPEA